MKVAKGLLILTVLSFLGCADAGSPESVTIKFVKALNGLDFKAAGELATEDGKKNLQMMESFMTMAQSQNQEPTLAENATAEEKTTYDDALKTFKEGQAEIEKQKVEAAKAEIKVVNTTLEGDTAKVEYRVIDPTKTEADSAETQKLDLKKVDGVWKVDLKKEA